MSPPRELGELKARLSHIANLGRVRRVLGWDLQVTMPPAGAPARGEQQATLDHVAHGLLTAPETGRLFERLRSYEDALDPASDDASLIRVARRDHEKAVRVPGELRAAIAKAASDGFAAWREAKERNRYALFRPHLERQVELKRRYVELFPEADDPYDVLLDDFEPSTTTADVRAVLARLKEALVPLAAAAASDEDLPVLARAFPKAEQEALARELVGVLGLAEGSWRLDSSAHPFSSGGGRNDVRITTRYEDHGLQSLFWAVHEYGHALYEQQLAPELEHTPLAAGASFGMHESQSRLWENLVARGRPFWSFFYPRLARRFRAQLDVDEETWLRAVNRVRPSLIRIAADELTYDLHIVLRFELEQELLAGRIGLGELPHEWNGRTHAYLGLDVPDDAHGVLQDVQWAFGAFGYFPTYSLGNVMSIQLWRRIESDLDVEDQIARGEFAPLREWLAEHVHRDGRKFTPQELLVRATGARLDPEPYLAYLRAKYEPRDGAAPSTFD